jgi:hypothetical protein
MADFSMTISGQVQILQCLQFLEVDVSSSDLAIVQEQNQPAVYRYVMAKLETTLPHSLSHETAYFRTCIAGLKSFRSVTGVGLRIFAVPRGLSDRIEIIDDRSQSAVVDSRNWFRDA